LPAESNASGGAAKLASEKKPGHIGPGKMNGGSRFAVASAGERTNAAMLGSLAYTDMKLALQPLAAPIGAMPAKWALLAVPVAGPASVERAAFGAAAVGALTIERSLIRILRDRLIVNLLV
jgi:hypothetical protein